MNSYEEIINLPYSLKVVSESLKELLKDNKIKNMILKVENDNSFILEAKAKLNLKQEVSIELVEKDTNSTVIKMHSCSKSWVLFDINANHKNVANIMDAIMDSIRDVEADADIEDVTVHINSEDDFTNNIGYFIVAIINFYIIILLLFLIYNEISDSNWNLSLFDVSVCLYVTTAVTAIYKVIINLYEKSYKAKRVSYIKQKIYNLVEEQDNINIDKKVNRKRNWSFDYIVKRCKKYFNMVLNYIKKIKKEKPQIFWVIIGIIAGLIIGIFFGRTSRFSDPCDFNVQMGGHRVNAISWCRDDVTIDSSRLPKGFDVDVTDFVYCHYSTPDTHNGWVEGYVYKGCATQKGW